MSEMELYTLKPHHEDGEQFTPATEREVIAWLSDRGYAVIDMSKWAKFAE